jgi:hypothetical protein
LRTAPRSCRRGIYFDTDAPNPLDGGRLGLRILAYPRGLDKKVGTMAEHAITDTVADADFAARVKTYRLFLGLLKFGLLTVVILLIILAVSTQLGRVG